MSEPIATTIDISSSGENIYSNLDGTAIPSQLSVSTMDPATPSQIEPNQGELERLRGIYENLLGLAEAGIVPDVGDMTEALGAVGFAVHSEAEVVGFVEFVALVKNGVDACSFEDFQALLQKATSAWLAEHACLPSVPGLLNDDPATPSYGYSFPSEPIQPAAEGGDIGLTLLDDEGSIFGSRSPSPSIFAPRDSSPERTCSIHPEHDPSPAPGLADSLFNSSASSHANSPPAPCRRRLVRRERRGSLAKDKSDNDSVDESERQRAEIASLKKAADALKEQLVESETSLHEMCDKCVAAEKRADEADARCYQLLSVQRSQETLIEQLHKEKRELLERLQKQSQREDALLLQLRVEQRARACTLIWKIAEDKRTQAQMQAIRKQTAKPESELEQNESEPLRSALETHSDGSGLIGNRSQKVQSQHAAVTITAQSNKAEAVRNDLAEKVAAGACYARLARRRRRGQSEWRFTC